MDPVGTQWLDPSPMIRTSTSQDWRMARRRMGRVRVPPTTCCDMARKSTQTSTEPERILTLGAPPGRKLWNTHEGFHKWGYPKMDGIYKGQAQENAIPLIYGLMLLQP